jgi:hypothetical protein
MKHRKTLKRRNRKTRRLRGGEISKWLNTKWWNTKWWKTRKNKNAVNIDVKDTKDYGSNDSDTSTNSTSSITTLASEPDNIPSTLPNTSVSDNDLKIICSDANQCLAFGVQNDRIKEMFNGFVNFEYARTHNSIGAPSANGFVNQIDYERDGYKCSTVLKSSRNKKADNLYYEYFVGTQFINEMVKIMPCFVETYGIFISKKEGMIERWYKQFLDAPLFHERMATSVVFDHLKEALGKSIPDDKMNIATSCANSARLSILIQNIKNPTTIMDYIKKNLEEYVDGKINITTFWNVDVVQLLYQIYGPLACLGVRFTHYDLHLNNVLLYKLQEKQWIQMVYHFKGEEIKFYTQYIAKIIDYGRSYCEKSPELYKQLCNSFSCMPSCGYYVGYKWFKEPSEESHYISTRYPNIRHDLRLARSIDAVKHETDGKFVTKEQENPNIDYEIYTIHDLDIHDLESRLRKQILENGIENPLNEGDFLVGTLHIYLDEMKPMEFY